MWEKVAFKRVIAYCVWSSLHNVVNIMMDVAALNMLDTQCNYFPLDIN